MRRADIISIIILLSLPVFAACSHLKGLPEGYDSRRYCLESGRCFTHYCYTGERDEVMAKVYQADSFYYVSYDETDESGQTTMCVRDSYNRRIRSVW